VEFVDLCLTSVYQPPDVIMNALLKCMIRNQYHDYVNDSIRNPFFREAPKAGSPIVVSRDSLVSFVENAFKSINEENIKK